MRDKPGEKAALPMIVREGKLNGVWFHSGAMILQNEYTVKNKDYITRIPYSEIHDGSQP